MMHKNEQCPEVKDQSLRGIVFMMTDKRTVRIVRRDAACLPACLLHGAFSGADR